MRTHPSLRAALATVVGTLGGCSPSASSDASGSSEGWESGSSGAVVGSSSGAAGAMGTVTLAFSVTQGVRMGPTLVDALVGPVYGGIFHTSDVTLIGPAEGVSPVISMEVDHVDLVTADVATTKWISEPLPAGHYTFLGMLDVDGNFHATDEGPDPGDPITLTSQSFEVIAGQDTAFMAIFEQIYG